MKYIIFITVLFFSYSVIAQEEVYSNTFVRIYNLDGKKINKGRIKTISKTSIELYLKEETIEIPLHKIGKIKTRRSGGNNIAKGAIIGGGSLALVGLLSGDDDKGIIYFSASDKSMMGLIGGGFIGGMVGGITAIFKKADTYIIDANELNLERFKEAMTISE
ncbi:hypothetical protein O4H26_06560 [Aequorivita viscosa]|nr:hypothetical protein [Aequorivita viscosa]